MSDSGSRSASAGTKRRAGDLYATGDLAEEAYDPDAVGLGISGSSSGQAQPTDMDTLTVTHTHTHAHTHGHAHAHMGAHGHMGAHMGGHAPAPGSDSPTAVTMATGPILAPGARPRSRKSTGPRRARARMAPDILPDADMDLGEDVDFDEHAAKVAAANVGSVGSVDALPDDVALHNLEATVRSHARKPGQVLSYEESRLVLQIYYRYVKTRLAQEKDVSFAQIRAWGMTQTQRTTGVGFDTIRKVVERAILGADIYQEDTSRRGAGALNHPNHTATMRGRGGRPRGSSRFVAETMPPEHVTAEATALFDDMMSAADAAALAHSNAAAAAGQTSADAELEMA